MQKETSKQKTAIMSGLKVGDTVMVISGGNKKKRPIKGQVGKILRFVGEKKDRVIVEGLNMFVRHQRAAGPDKPAGKIMAEKSIHVSNVMYYVEELKKPVRLMRTKKKEGKKTLTIRGYKDPKSKTFVALEKKEGAK